MFHPGSTKELHLFMYLRILKESVLKKLQKYELDDRHTPQEEISVKWLKRQRKTFTYRC